MKNGMTCGSLLREIHFTWERIARELLKDSGLSWTQMTALGKLTGSKGHELSLKNLEKKLGLSQSVVARMVKQLVEKGFVEYAADYRNKLVKRVRLLEKGRHAHQVFVASLEGEEPPLLRDMSPGETLLFQELLESALDNSLQFYDELRSKSK